MKRRHFVLSLASLGLATPAFADPTLTTLVQFEGVNGFSPCCTLISDSAGNLYGTTLKGGSSNDGTVFQLTPSGTINTLVTFNGPNGFYPEAGLTADSYGNLYGTTQEFDSRVLANAYGTVFEVSANTHSFSTLANFKNTNGEYILSGVTLDRSGNIYGTCYQGGDLSQLAGAGAGTVYKVDATTHALSNPVIFNGSNGLLPAGGLILDSGGNFYGTTAYGGPSKCGTIFEIAAGTNTITTLATFNASNGQTPASNLLLDSDGNLYGTTTSGGNLSINNGSGGGTVFELPRGSNTPVSLYKFSRTDGAEPSGTLIADAAGNLYGTTQAGGGSNYGTVFKLTLGSNTLTTLVTFNLANGYGPSAGLMADGVGNLYGTTCWGGDLSLNSGIGVGTVFELSGSGFVVPEPASLSLLGLGLFGLLTRRRRHVVKS